MSASRGWRVTVLPDEKKFVVSENETILDAALRQGVFFDYGCRLGQCTRCKYLVTEGDVDIGKVSPYSLNEREIEDGWALLCQARARSDLVIGDPKPADREGISFPRPELVSASVEDVQQVGSSTLWSVELQPDRDFEFLPGQFIEIEIPWNPGTWRSYSIASRPGAGSLKLIIKKFEGGAFSSRIAELPGYKTVRLRGPYGTSFLRPGVRPVLMVATGSGIAPMLSFLSDAAERGNYRKFSLFYGVRSEDDLAILDQIDERTREILNLDVKIAVSQPRSDNGQLGTGRVTQAIQRFIVDASLFDVYICGNPQMCENAALLLAAKGAPEERIYQDAFYLAQSQPNLSQDEAENVI
jgi:NAD(P)H-flavin reductase/ferredoxin